jgi:hypothetical protein
VRSPHHSDGGFGSALYQLLSPSRCKRFTVWGRLRRPVYEQSVSLLSWHLAFYQLRVTSCFLLVRWLMDESLHPRALNTTTYTRFGRDRFPARQPKEPGGSCSLVLGKACALWADRRFLPQSEHNVSSGKAKPACSHLPAYTSLYF